SGGPLVNIQGQVIGINSAIASETGYYAGYGFAIPINLARTVMDQLVKTGHVERAVMGIRIDDARQEDAEAVGLKQIRGVLVESFSPGASPAKEAGLQPGDVGVAPDGPAYGRLFSADDGGPDIIISVNGTPTRTRAALREALRKVKSGEIVTLQVMSRTGDPSSNGWSSRIVRLRAR